LSKLLLFDVDGTLITGHGVPKKVAFNVITKRFPEFSNGHEVAFNGMTDPLIVKEILAANNHPINIDDPIIDEVLDDFIRELAKHVNPESPPKLLPGVIDFLELCVQTNNIFIGLVTGNIMQGAKIKLSAIGIYKYFAIGAFGSDHWNRNELPPVAIRRAEKYFLKEFHADDVWIIGDSPKDVECAKTNDLKCLAVETGKVQKQILETAGADFVLPDLNNLDKLTKILSI